MGANGKATGIGIDVSGWNGSIDWAKAKQSIDFAVIKIGNVYQYDSMSLESTFKANVAGCEKVGLPYGLYLYTYVQSPGRMREVMTKVMSEVRNVCKNISMPIYLDIEEQAVVRGGNANTLAMCKVFAESVKANGFTPGIYSSTYWYETYLTSDWYQTLNIWCADWSSRCSYGKRYDMWQYSEGGRVPGIVGNVDHNIAYFDFAGDKHELTNDEQIYTVRDGDTWDSVGKLYGMNHGGVYLLEYNNYATASKELAQKPITQKTIKIPARWIVGDVDGDGRVTAKDAREALRASAKLDTLTADEKMRADTDGDGTVTAKDARTILRKSANLK